MRPLLRVSRLHWIMYVFGAILIFIVRTDPFIVYTSNIFAILGLRAMHFLLVSSPRSTYMRRVGK